MSKNRSGNLSRLRRLLAADHTADAITVTPEALRLVATMAAFVGAFFVYCWLVSLVA